MATLKDSRKQEARQAQKFGGSVNSGSGNGWMRKGDVRTSHELWELKITSAKSYSLKDEELQKNINNALMDGRIPIFLVEFKSTSNRYVIMDENDYIELRERAYLGNEVESEKPPLV